MTLEHPHAELSAYIDGALAPAAQAAVGEHVAACAVCRAHVAQLRATVAFVRALPDPVPSRRLVPRLAGPAWLAPLRTVMTLASGAAVFLFIASSLVSNITFLASSGAPTVGSAEAARDSATSAAQGAALAQATSTNQLPAPAASPNAAFAVSGPTASPLPDAAKSIGGAPTPDDAAKRSDQTTAVPAAPGAVAPQETGRVALAEPQRSPLLNPWLWLVLAVLCGALAIALQRRLRGSV